MTGPFLVRGIARDERAAVLEIVNAAAEGRSEPAPTRPRRSAPLHPDQVEAAGRLGDALGRALGADVQVAPKGEGYKVTLAFESLDEAMAMAVRLGAVEHA